MLRTELLERAIVATKTKGSTILRSHVLDLAEEVVALRAQLAALTDPSPAAQKERPPKTVQWKHGEAEGWLSGARSGVIAEYWQVGAVWYIKVNDGPPIKRESKDAAIKAITDTVTARGWQLVTE